MSVLSATDSSNIRQMILGVDDEPIYDVTFFLYAVCYYAIARVACEHLYPGRIKGYTKQQYVVALAHQALVLPACSFVWAVGLMDDAPALIYLLTGAYMASDSIINYTPVAGTIRRVVGDPPGGGPTFSWGVHAHHIFTIVLCALGPNLPPWPVVEGAFCILLGEAGSLWISITLLYPNKVNYTIRFWLFLVTRSLGFPIALDIARQITYWPVLVAWLALVAVGQPSCGFTYACESHLRWCPPLPLTSALQRSRACAGSVCRQLQDAVEDGRYEAGRQAGPRPVAAIGELAALWQS